MKASNTFKQEDNILTHTRLLDAPIDLVWEVWTTPEHIKEWWGPNGFSLTTKSMNVAVGDQWEFIMHGMGRDWYNKIQYIEVKSLTFCLIDTQGQRMKIIISLFPFSLKKWT